MYTKFILILLLNVLQKSSEIYVTSNNTRQNKIANDNPAVWTEGEIWGPILEDWVINDHRVGRVTQLTPAQSENQTADQKLESDRKESKISANIKVVNNVGGTRKPPVQIRETDMYLLGAIEKLVYRVDFMEKRIRKLEEMLYYVMTGSRVDQEPCSDNFNRAGANCYLFAGTAGRELDWKAASKHCKRYGAVLTEMETIEENQDVIAYIQTQDHLRGRDFWIGGLNPGLLWIWSNSARPIKTPTSPNKQDADPGAAIPGKGRCLQLIYNPALKSYNYRGTDCAVRTSYICEAAENSATNELTRIGRNNKIFNEL